jgi:hypothetical protein
MNRSYSKIRHIQESNENLEKRLMSPESMQDLSSFNNMDEESDLEGKELEDFIEADEYALELNDRMSDEIESLVNDLLINIDLENFIKRYQNKFKKKYPMYVNTEMINDNIDTLMNFNVKDDLKYIAAMMTSSLIDEIYPK